MSCKHCRGATCVAWMALGLSGLALLYATWFIPMLTDTVTRLTRYIEGGEKAHAERIERSVTETPKRDH